MSYLDRTLTVRGKKYFPYKDVLVYDIETKSLDENKGISSDNAKCRIWGAYSYNTNKLTIGTSGEEFRKLVNKHKFIVGHNIKDFDNPIMEKDFNINFRGKIIIDTLEVLRKPPSKSEKETAIKKGKKPIYGKGRSLIIGEARQIGIDDNRFPSLSLKEIPKHGRKIFADKPHYLKYFKVFKGDIDYSILNKEIWTEDERLEIEEYLRKDIIVTKNLFEFLEVYFAELGLPDFLSEKDIINLEYVIAPTGTYGYKVLNHALSLKESFGSGNRERFKGAFVFLPVKDKYDKRDGMGYYCDYSSQHPTNIKSANLFTPIEKCKNKIDDKCPNPYSGDGTIFKFKGTYCSCKQGEVENIIDRFLHMKREFSKQKNPKAYGIKIILNSIYGLGSSPVFENFYNETTGPDTTIASEQSTRYMASFLINNKYIIAGGDTDGLMVFDPFFDKDRLIKYLNEGIENIKNALPFADEHYKMTIDEEFTNVYFFQDEKSKDLHYKKKNYILIKSNNTVKVVGLPLIKKNSPAIAKLIYKKYLVEQIIETKNIKFEKDYLGQLIHYEIRENLSILATKTRCKPALSYATLNQMQAQISLKYFDGGMGEFIGIKHKRKGLGVGKGKHYCLLEEAKQLKISELDLDTVWSVLKPFIKTDKQQRLFDY